MNASGRRKIEFSALLILILLIVFAGSVFAFRGQGPEAVPQYTVTEIRQISLPQAREIAMEFVGYGEVYDIKAFTHGDELRFEAMVLHNGVRYVVEIDGVYGNIISLARTVDATPQSTMTPPPISTPAPYPTPTSTPAPSPPPTATPVPPSTPSHTTPSSNNQSQGSSSRSIRPSNPAISLEMAIELAYADLAARGIDATFRRDSGMDWERGQWVWELEFRPTTGRGEIEFYINVDTGEIVKFEWDR